LIVQGIGNMPSKEEVIKQIKRYYLFYGPNDYRLRERVTSLVKAVIEPGSEAFDLDRFDGNVHEAPDIVNAVSTPPVISPLRVVTLSDTEELSPTGQAFLESFLSKIPEYSVLAMTAAKIDKRSKLFKRLSSEEKGPKVTSEAVHTFSFDEFGPGDAITLISQFASERKKSISSQTAGAMVEIFGTDPYKLENEIEKMSLYIGEKAEIEKKDLAFASGLDRVETPDELPGMILDGKIGRALEFCRKAIASGISEFQIMFILRNYLIGLNLAMSIKSQSQLAGLLRTRPVLIRPKANEDFWGVVQRKAQDFYSRSRKTNQDAVAKGLTYLFRAEYSLKSARFEPEGVIELLIIALYLVFNGNKSSSELYLV
jgi:DNA polymerase-3 subunit delta